VEKSKLVKTQRHLLVLRVKGRLLLYVRITNIFCLTHHYRYNTLIFYNRHWLTERSEEVMAKGKGLMHTFWCDPSSPNFHSDGSTPSASMANSETSSENEFDA